MGGEQTGDEGRSFDHGEREFPRKGVRHCLDNIIIRESKGLRPAHRIESHIQMNNSG